MDLVRLVRATVTIAVYQAHLLVIMDIVFQDMASRKDYALHV